MGVGFVLPGLDLKLWRYCLEPIFLLLMRGPGALQLPSPPQTHLLWAVMTWSLSLQRVGALRGLHQAGAQHRGASVQ